MPLIPESGRQRQEDLCKFQVSLVQWSQDNRSCAETCDSRSFSVLWFPRVQDHSLANTVTRKSASKTDLELGVAAHTFNPSIWEIEAGGSL